MLLEHKGGSPTIHDSAVVSPNAVVSGDVTIGAETVVLAGAVLTSEGAPLTIGPRCIVMENSTVRASKAHPCSIGNHVFIGPQVHIVGADIAPRCFVSTGAIIFNGAKLEEGCMLSVHGVVHINTRCPASTFIPMGYAAFGDPARLYGPHQAMELHRRVASRGFTSSVFGFDSSDMSIPDSVEVLCDRYLKSLLEHAGDKEL